MDLVQATSTSDYSSMVEAMIPVIHGIQVVIQYYVLAFISLYKISCKRISIVISLTHKHDKNIENEEVFSKIKSSLGSLKSEMEK